MVISQFLLVIFTPIVSLIGIVTNLFVLLTIVNKKNRSELKEKHYTYMAINSISNILILVIQILSLINECQYPFGIFCSSVRKYMFVQYFKIIIVETFSSFLRLVSNLTYVDECLKKYNDEQVINQLLSSQTNGFCENIEFYVIFHENMDLSKHTEDHLWPESTKITDYLNQVRMRTIQELRKAQEDALEFYKLNLSRFKSELSNNKKNIDELRSELFAEKFYFQV